MNVQYILHQTQIDVKEIIIIFCSILVKAWDQNDDPLSFRSAPDTHQWLPSQSTRVNRVSTQPTYLAQHAAQVLEVVAAVFNNLFSDIQLSN